MDLGEKISQSEFARRVGVTQPMINKAIGSGRIQKTASGKIDWDSQSIAWERNRSIHKDHESRGLDRNSDIHRKYKEVLTTFKYYDAKLRELKYKELEGELISKENLMKRLLPKLTLIKSHMMTLPARHSHTMAARLIRNAEKLSKSKSFHKILAKMDEQQLARDIGEILDSDLRGIMKELGGASGV